MYAALIILLLSLAIGSILWGYRQKNIFRVTFGLLVLSGTVLYFYFLSFRDDALCYTALGGPGCFQKVIFYRVLFAVLGGTLGFAVLRFLTLFIFDSQQLRARRIATMAGLYFGAKWGSLSWDTVILFFNRVTTGTQDPILKKDLGFYIFSLPFYEQLYQVLFGLCVIGLLSAIAGVFLTVKDDGVEFRTRRVGDAVHARGLHWMYVNASLLFFVLAWGRYLDRFHVLYAQYDPVFNIGWTNVNIPLPAAGSAGLILAGGVLLLGAGGALKKLVKDPSVTNHHGLNN